MVAARHPGTRWVTRLIPFFLAACVGFTSYVFYRRICADYYIQSERRHRTAIALLILYSVSLILMVLTYLRVLFVIQFNSGVVPLGPLAAERREKEQLDKKERRKAWAQCHGGGGHDLEANRYEGYWPDPNVDSPGLELFYSKDVFICHTDGRPRWCTACSTWKQDRVSHCRDINRCVRKLDHYCPWVGGVVAGTSYKFFVLFTFYTTLYCAMTVIVGAIVLQAKNARNEPADGFIIGSLVLGGFFGIFASALTVTASHYIFKNLTNVDYLKTKNMVYQLAIRVPRGTPAGLDYAVINYPLPKLDTATPSPHSSGQPPPNEPASSRDLLATRTFAVVRTEKGENPWDLGFYRNWKSVMGNNPIDWVLPIHLPPSESYENNVSFYEMGPLVEQLRKRFNLPGLPDMEKEGGIESKELNTTQH